MNEVGVIPVHAEKNFMLICLLMDVFRLWIITGISLSFSGRLPTA